VIAWLLSAMRKLSQPVKPRDLGAVGHDHLLARFTESGADPETFAYRSAAVVQDDGPPFFIEAAFAYRGDDDENGAAIIEGFNFTPAIGGSPFRLEGHLAEARVQDYDPIIAFVHLTSPGLHFLDRGKAQVALPAEVAGEIVGLAKGVTAKWTKQKRAEIRDAQPTLSNGCAITSPRIPKRRGTPPSEPSAKLMRPHDRIVGC
jgi:DNA topoisomerase VI subunit B